MNFFPGQVRGTTGERMRKLFIIVIYLLFGIPDKSDISAQTESIDSLDRVLHMTVESDKRLVLLNQMAYKLRNQNPQKSKDLLTEALSIARKSDNKEEIAYSLASMGYLLNGSDDYSLALNNYTEALNIYRELDEEDETNFDTRIAYMHYQIGSLYKTLGNYEKGIENCLAGLKIYETLNDKPGIALIYRVMGSIYKYREDYEKTLFYYFSGLKINEEVGNNQGIANSYNNIGIVYLLMKDYKKALDYYKKSLQINLTANNESESAINFGNIGIVYLEINEADSAFYYFNRRYEIALRQNDKKGIALAMSSFGDFHFRKKDYEKAIDYYKKGLSLSRELGILETTKNILKKISDLNQEKNNFKEGFYYYRSYISLRDSLLNRETLHKIEQMQMEYSLEKERNNHQFAEQRTRLYVIAGFVTLLLSVLFLILVYLSLKLKLKRKNLEQKKNELDKIQLRNEINFRDKELVGKAINLAEKNELNNDIIRRLKSVINDPKVSGNEVKDIIKDLQFNSENHLWEEFEYTFLQVHPDYYSALAKHFPELTANERRLSAFLRLNLTTKEISNITHQSNHTLTVARTRLRKKLGIAHSGENLSSFLSKF
jgi:tetratricopeptide (TPR) repeat protein